VLDAAVELFTEGNFDPGPDEVAARAGLSARSVYRYFEDREALVRAAVDRQLEKAMPLFLMHQIGKGPFAERVDRFVAARAGLYEVIAPVARAARVRAATTDDGVIRAQVERTRRALRGQVERHFAPELAALAEPRRRAAAAAADTLCQFEALDHYRLHRRCSAAQTRQLLTDALVALFAPPAERSTP
jgi:AcrR family transcriptional regulator